MQLTRYYTFLPTAALAEEAGAANEEWLLEPEIVEDIEHDRTGPNHPQDEIERAFWTIFLAKLLSEDPEPAKALRFRRRCVELGLAGCWTVQVVRGGSSAEELIAEAKDAAPYAEQAIKC